MNTKPSFFGIVCRVTAFTFLMAGTASLMQAQQSSSADSNPKAPLFLASNADSTNLAAPSNSIFSTSSSSSSSSSDSEDAAPADSAHFKLSSDALDPSQPPPRRRYGRPNYSDAHSNPDGSAKWDGPDWRLRPETGRRHAHKYETPSWGLQVGASRVTSTRPSGVIAQFDYDHFGLQGATINKLKPTSTTTAAQLAQSPPATAASPAWTPTTTSGHLASTPPSRLPPKVRWELTSS